MAASGDGMVRKGSCLCGAVRFEVRGELPAPDACHCDDCRKFSGHYFVSTDVPRDRVTIHGEEAVRWYALDERVRRGFCGTCGSSLFWDPIAHDWIALALGAFDDPVDTKVAMHIWMEDKPDYYEVGGDAPRFRQRPDSHGDG